MNDLVSTIRSSAATELGGDGWAPDWADVLGRACVRPRPRRALLSRRAAVVGGLAAAALVLTLPGIGLGGRLKDLVAGSSRPGFELRAILYRPSGGSVGYVSLRTSRLFVEIARGSGRVVRPFVPRRPVEPLRVDWRLNPNRGVSVTSARIVRAGNAKQLIAQLCAPCGDGAHGVIRLRRRGLSAIFGRGALVVAQTSSGVARGTIRLEPPAMRRG